MGRGDVVHELRTMSIAIGRLKKVQTAATVRQRRNTGAAGSAARLSAIQNIRASARELRSYEEGGDGAGAAGSEVIEEEGEEEEIVPVVEEMSVMKSHSMGRIMSSNM